MDTFESNSHKSKEENLEKKKVEKVITGTAKAKKKGEIHKLADIFISEDVTNVKSYILLDVLVPAIKKAISDIVTNGIDMVLYGEKGGHNRSSSSSTASKVSYRNYYDRGGDRGARQTTRSATGYSYDDICLDNRGEAEDVLSRMDELISMYGLVSVADFYDLVGVTGNYTDNRYGWTDIRSASVIRVRDGYMIKLPKALPLN